MRWADEEPATQSGFRIGASQQVCAGVVLGAFSTNVPMFLSFVTLHAIVVP